MKRTYGLNRPLAILRAFYLNSILTCPLGPIRNSIFTKIMQIIRARRHRKPMGLVSGVRLISALNVNATNWTHNPAVHTKFTIFFPSIRSAGKYNHNKFNNQRWRRTSTATRFMFGKSLPRTVLWMASQGCYHCERERFVYLSKYDQRGWRRLHMLCG